MCMHIATIYILYAKHILYIFFILSNYISYILLLCCMRYASIYATGRRLRPPRGGSCRARSPGSAGRTAARHPGYHRGSLASGRARRPDLDSHRWRGTASARRSPCLGGLLGPIGGAFRRGQAPPSLPYSGMEVIESQYGFASAQRWML